MAARTEHTSKRRQGSKIAPVNEPRSGSQKQQEENAIPVWEWIVAAIGLVLVASVIGFLLYEAIAGSRLPPDVKLSVDSVVQIRNGFLAKITAVNEGGITAEGVDIEGELKRGNRAKPDHHRLPAAALGKEGRSIFYSRSPAA
jgi:hypothetical protein